MAFSKKQMKRLHDFVAVALGNSNPHEREVARQKLEEWLTKNKKSWNDLHELLRTDGTAADKSWTVFDDGNEAEASPAPAATDDAPTPLVVELVHHIIQQYVDLKPHEYIVVALWILYTHVYNRFRYAPRLAFTSPVHGCGKSTALDMCEVMGSKTERMVDPTVAAIYWQIDERPGCTLLVEEGQDIGLLANTRLVKVLDSGYRKGDFVHRVINGAVKKFSTFAPAAIAAIGLLPLPLMSRSFNIKMERSDGDGRLKMLIEEDKNDGNSDLNIIYREILKWAKTVALNEMPEMPAKFGRIADNWRPLISVADSFGPTWGSLARDAALTFRNSYSDEDAAVVLLADIRTIFNDAEANTMSSERLVGALNDMEDGLWSEWRGLKDDQQPRKLSQGQLAFMLKPFNIRPRSIWSRGSKPGSKSRKGYRREYFERAWAQYCPEDGNPAESNQVRQLRVISDEDE